MIAAHPRVYTQEDVLFQTWLQRQEKMKGPFNATRNLLQLAYGLWLACGRFPVREIPFPAFPKHAHQTSEMILRVLAEVIEETIR